MYLLLLSLVGIIKHVSWSTAFYHCNLVFLHSLPFHQLCANISSHLILEPGILLPVPFQSYVRPYLDYIAIHAYCNYGVNLWSIPNPVIVPLRRGERRTPPTSSTPSVSLSLALPLSYWTSCKRESSLTLPSSNLTRPPAIRTKTHQKRRKNHRAAAESKVQQISLHPR